MGDRYAAYDTTQLLVYIRQQERDAAQGIGVKRAERELRWAWHELDLRLTAGAELPRGWRNDSAERELAEAVAVARKAAWGDSNDEEIDALQIALDLALARWPQVPRTEEG